MLKTSLAQVFDEIAAFQTRLHDIQSSTECPVSGFKPAVSLNAYLSEMKQKCIEVPLHNSAGVFLIKSVLGILDQAMAQGGAAAGALSEREIRTIFASTCQELNVKLNERGGIVGLSMDVSTVCSVLHSLGVIVAVDPAALPAPVGPAAAVVVVKKESVSMPSGAGVGSAVVDMTTAAGPEVGAAVALFPKSEADVAVEAASVQSAGSGGSTPRPKQAPSDVQKGGSVGALPLLPSLASASSPLGGVSVSQLTHSASAGALNTLAAGAAGNAGICESPLLLSQLGGGGGGGGASGSKSLVAVGGAGKQAQFGPSSPAGSGQGVSRPTSASLAPAGTPSSSDRIGPIPAPGGGSGGAVPPLGSTRAGSDNASSLNSSSNSSSRSAGETSSGGVAMQQQDATSVKSSSGSGCGSVVLRAFTSRWNDAVNRYVKVLKDLSNKQQQQQQRQQQQQQQQGINPGAPAPISAAISKAVELAPHPNDTRMWALFIPAGPSSAAADNDADALTVDLSAHLQPQHSTAAKSIDSSSGNGIGSSALTPLCVVTHPKASLQTLCRLAYTEAALEETEELLMRRVLGQCGLDVNDNSAVDASASTLHSLLGNNTGASGDKSVAEGATTEAGDSGAPAAVAVKQENPSGKGSTTTGGKPTRRRSASVSTDGGGGNGTLSSLISQSPSIVPVGHLQQINLRVGTRYLLHGYKHISGRHMELPVVEKEPPVVVVNKPAGEAGEVEGKVATTSRARSSSSSSATGSTRGNGKGQKKEAAGVAAGAASTSEAAPDSAAADATGASTACDSGSSSAPSAAPAAIAPPPAPAPVAAFIYHTKASLKLLSRSERKAWKTMARAKGIKPKRGRSSKAATAAAVAAVAALKKRSPGAVAAAAAVCDNSMMPSSSSPTRPSLHISTCSPTPGGGGSGGTPRSGGGSSSGSGAASLAINGSIAALYRITSLRNTPNPHYSTEALGSMNALMGSPTAVVGVGKGSGDVATAVATPASIAGASLSGDAATGCVLTAQVLIEKARKLKKYREAQNEPIEVLSQRYHAVKVASMPDDYLGSQYYDGARYRYGYGWGGAAGGAGGGPGVGGRGRGRGAGRGQGAAKSRLSGLLGLTGGSKAAVGTSVSAVGLVGGGGGRGSGAASKLLERINVGGGGGAGFGGNSSAIANLEASLGLGPSEGPWTPISKLARKNKSSLPLSTSANSVLAELALTATSSSSSASSANSAASNLSSLLSSSLGHLQRKRKHHMLQPTPMPHNAGAVVLYPYGGIAADNVLFAPSQQPQLSSSAPTGVGFAAPGSGGAAGMSRSWSTGSTHSVDGGGSGANTPGTAKLKRSHSNASMNGAAPSPSPYAQSSDGTMMDGTPTSASDLLLRGIPPRPPLVLHPDCLLVRTSAIPWPLVAREFVEDDKEQYVEELGDFGNVVRSSSAGAGVGAGSGSAPASAPLSRSTSGGHIAGSGSTSASPTHGAIPAGPGGRNAKKRKTTESPTPPLSIITNPVMLTGSAGDICTPSDTPARSSSGGGGIANGRRSASGNDLRSMYTNNSISSDELLQSLTSGSGTDDPASSAKPMPSPGTGIGMGMGIASDTPRGESNTRPQHVHVSIVFAPQYSEIDPGTYGKKPIPPPAGSALAGAGASAGAAKAGMPVDVAGGGSGDDDEDDDEDISEATFLAKHEEVLGKMRSKWTEAQRERQAAGGAGGNTRHISAGPPLSGGGAGRPATSSASMNRSISTPALMQSPRTGTGGASPRKHVKLTPTSVTPTTSTHPTKKQRLSPSPAGPASPSTKSTE